MLINDLSETARGGTRVLSGTVRWEDCDYPEQRISFETDDDGIDGDAFDRDDEWVRDAPLGEPSGDAFLCGCFPLAAVHGEARIRVEARACPMLVEGLRTAHA
jgi:hypothetical protein